MLRVKLLDGLLQLLNVFERKFPRLGELRHHRLGPASEETENLIEQPVPRHVPGHDRFKDVGIADFTHAAHGFLPF